jgi:hypothetical protein
MSINKKPSQYFETASYYYFQNLYLQYAFIYPEILFQFGG